MTKIHFHSCAVPPPKRGPLIIKYTAMKYPLTLLVLLFGLLAGCRKDIKPSVLWYDKPAADWNEALPVGNGRLGAMVFGDPENETLQINEESIWAGSKINNNNQEALANLPALQQAIFNGEMKKAEEIANNFFLGTPPRIRSYQPLGELIINYKWNGTITGYKRSLDIRSGIASTSFRVNGEPVSESIFSSAPDNILVVNIKASGKEKYKLQLSTRDVKGMLK